MQSSKDSSPFLQSVRDAIRVRHLSIRTEEVCAHWIKRFIFFHAKRHPRELGEREVAAFLSYLASDHAGTASPSAAETARRAVDRAANPDTMNTTASGEFFFK